MLFPDAKPLVERLGRDFFRQLPTCAGVYLMRDGQGAVVYVGKAKNLRQRLGSYRVANPDRLPKRLLRLLKSVARIELQECADEEAALSREAELLRELKPKFNRAGVWPAPPKMLVWRRNGEGIELGVATVAESDWAWHGPLKGGSAPMLTRLVRLLWGLAYPEMGLIAMPAGWFHGRLPERVPLRQRGAEIEGWLGKLIEVQAAETIPEVMLEVLSESYSGWQLELLNDDLEAMVSYFRPKVPAFPKGLPLI